MSAADRCTTCGKRRDVHAWNYFSRRHTFSDARLMVLAGFQNEEGDE